MMQRAVVAALMLANVSCPRSSARQPPASSTREIEEPDDDQTIDECPVTVAPAQEAELDGGAAPPAPAPRARPRTRVVKVWRSCAPPAPEIEPVSTSECMPGLVCLDAPAQAALARNLASYEAWVRRVIDCEQ